MYSSVPHGVNLSSYLSLLLLRRLADPWELPHNRQLHHLMSENLNRRGVASVKLSGIGDQCGCRWKDGRGCQRFATDTSSFFHDLLLQVTFVDNDEPFLFPNPMLPGDPSVGVVSRNE